MFPGELVPESLRLMRRFPRRFGGHFFSRVRFSQNVWVLGTTIVRQKTFENPGRVKRRLSSNGGFLGVRENGCVVGTVERGYESEQFVAARSPARPRFLILST